jgi:hypothetical protein
VTVVPTAGRKMSVRTNNWIFIPKRLLECNNVLLTLPAVIALGEDEFCLLNSGEF